MSRSAVLLAVLLVMLFATGCIPRKDRGELLKNVETLAVRMENTHTDVPDLLIRVPSNFVVEWTKEARYEKYFIYNPRDTGEVQKGMAIIDITPYPALHIADTAENLEKSIGMIGGEKGREVIWKEFTVEELGSAPLYQRETTVTGMFEEADKFREVKHSLHAFIVGSDPELVEVLTASVETITVLPRKPNL